MLPLTEEENKSHSKQKICHMRRKKKYIYIYIGKFKIMIIIQENIGVLYILYAV